MTQWSARQILTLLLAVLVTLSMSLSIVQASTMTATMGDMPPTMTKMIMGGSGHGTCKDCTKGGEGSSKAIACGPVCVTPMTAMLPLDFSTAFTRASVPLMKPYSLLYGKVPAPDPYPPRRSIP